MLPLFAKLRVDSFCVRKKRRKVYVAPTSDRHVFDNIDERLKPGNNFMCLICN